ncbi:MAG: TRAP transporter substrate-binding protein [Ectothiorhodospiraceae bacterium]|nr:TRAP transporter substrate-binding protein [Ectothiorhodospiraceae bacterium]
MKTSLLRAAVVALGVALGGSAHAETIVLKAGHSANPDEPYHIGLTEFARIVKERTNGRVEVQIFPNNQLGNEKEMIEGLLLGTLDITVPSNGVVTNFVPQLGIFDLPFLFRDRAHMYKVMDGPVGQTLDKAMQAKGFRLLGFYEAGIRHIMTRSKPINSYADLQGLKIRTMGVPAHVASFNAFGANATPLAYSELYGALQSGVVDGAEAANTNYNSKKFYEVAPHWAQIGWTALVADLIMSEQRYQSLPADVQAILSEAGLASAAAERAAYEKSDNSLLGDLKEKGVKVTHPDPKPFREASKAVYDAFVKTEQDRALLDAILATE